MLTVRRRRSRFRLAGGFTLVEVLVTVAIVGLLAAAAHPMLKVQKRRGQEMELRAALRSLRGALDAYKRLSDDGRIERSVDASGFPPSLDVLVQGVRDLRQPDGRKIYLLRRLPRDPFADPTLPAADTWITRSYESPPDDPHPGKDVFDVRSRSEASALDGSRYADW